MAQPKVVHGSGRQGGHGPKPKLDNAGLLLKRLTKFLMGKYAFPVIIVLLCILGSSLATVQGTLFIQSLIDDYITPMIGASSPDFGPLKSALLKMACIYIIGILCSWAYNQIMVRVSQGALHDIRVTLFTKMESLPIKYFDTHPHGDIMSVYTNDVDTLRQLIGVSLPQLASSVITIVSVFVSMLYLSVPLTIITLFMVGVMMLVTRNVASLSGRYFMAQQQDIGKVNGYIEEMMEGQKVVKVFCHEEESLAGFRQLNENLRESANNANKFANILMPLNAQLGHVSYVVCAIAGALFAANGQLGLTIGTLVSFLTLNRNFNQPITQVSQQLNSVVMALAGADRIFKLMDETPEVDEGYVTLVRAKKDSDGNIVECRERTGMWAWKHSHQANGTVTYTELTGDVV